MDLEKIEKQPQKKNKGSLLAGILIGTAVTLTVLALVGLVTVGVLMKNGFGQNKYETLKIIMEQNDFLDEEMIAKISTIEDMIDIYYYEEGLEGDALEEGMYRGILNAVGDPYTCYYSKEELNKLMEQTSGIYYGIGAYVSLDATGLYPMISAPIAGSPAEEADLRPGDIIYEINGESTYGKNLDSAVALIKGKEGTKVELTIVRSTETDYLHVELIRRRVEAPTVTYEMLEDGMAYIQISEFSDITVPQFADALATAKGSDMKGLILDLRSNPGGSLTSVVDIARMLLPEGLVVYTEDKYGERDEYFCDGKKEFDAPMVVLINGGSASASEVLAGAIKDYQLGTLVGTTTFGKGIVQQVFQLNDGSAIKVTTSSYYSPKGNNIHGTGIEPDKVCEFDGEAYYSEESFDNQLEYAKEVLKDMMK